MAREYEGPRAGCCTAVLEGTIEVDEVRASSSCSYPSHGMLTPPLVLI